MYLVDGEFVGRGDDGFDHVLERIGFGMFDWLVSVAEKRKLQIEWLPDQSASCQDCELNK
jgi:hypothetical protein